jgi:hypothetical protein
VTAPTSATERAGLATWVTESRAQQGLGPRITDEDVLLRVAAMVAAGLRRREERHTATKAS